MKTIDEPTIREVLAVYFRLFPTDNPLGDEIRINKVVNEFYVKLSQQLYGGGNVHSDVR